MGLPEQLEQHLGNTYHLEHELGGGGMSRVFLARELRLGRKVVIKVLNPDLAQGVSVDRFTREITMLASLQQANIVPVFSAGEVNGLPWFSMPYVEGDSLRKRLQQGGLPLPEVLSILRDVARALNYAHGHNVVHRDIKPDNVLLSGGVAVVTDFGIAKALSVARTGADATTLTALGAAIGTPAYMAPEQVAADPDLDHRADLYSLGCLGYELLTGHAPFHGRSAQKILAAHVSELPASVKQGRLDTPPALAGLVMQLLAKDPDMRVQSALEVLTILNKQGFESGQPRLTAGQASLGRALSWYFAAAVVVGSLGWAATHLIGLPEWVLPGAMGIMLVGLPVVFLAAWAQQLSMYQTEPGKKLHASPSTIRTLVQRASPYLTWPRLLRQGGLALLLFVVTVIGYMGLRAEGIGPAGTLQAAGRLGSGDMLLLSDLVATSPEDQALIPSVLEGIRSDLGQSQAIRLVSQDDVAEVLTEMGRDRRDRLNEPALVREVAERAGAKAVLGGQIARVGSNFLISLELRSTSKDTVFASFRSSASADNFVATLGTLTRKMRGKIGESLRSIQRSVPLERATTSSLAALRKYNEAVIQNDDSSHFEAAAVAAREAVRLDPAFALAWRKLAVVLSRAGMPYAAIDSAKQRMMENIDRLPERERYLILAQYYSNGRFTQLDSTIHYYHRVLSVDSLEVAALNNLAFLYELSGQFDSALSFYRRMSGIWPGPSPLGKQALILSYMGKQKQAEPLMDSAWRWKPNPENSDPSLVQDLQAVWASAGLSDSLEGLMRRQARNQTPGMASFNNNVFYYWLLSAGRPLEASRLERRAESGLLQAYGFEGFNQLLLMGQGSKLLLRLKGLLADPQWQALPHPDRSYSSLIILAAAAGDPQRARGLLRDWSAHDPITSSPDFQRMVIPGLEGLILLAEHRSQEAVAVIRSVYGLPSFYRYSAQAAQIATAFDQVGNVDSTIAWLERYLAISPGQRLVQGATNSTFLTVLYEVPALADLRLAQLYDQRGENTRAVGHYQAFITQWKGAEPEFQPIVTAARKRLGELQSTDG